MDGKNQRNSRIGNQKFITVIFDLIIMVMFMKD